MYTLSLESSLNLSALSSGIEPATAIAELLNARKSAFDKILIDYKMVGNAFAATKWGRRGVNALNESRDAKRAFSTVTDITNGKSVSNIATNTNATQAAKALKENGYTMKKAEGKTYNFYKGGQKVYGINFRKGAGTLEKYAPGRKKAVRKIRLSSQ